MSWRTSPVSHSTAEARNNDALSGVLLELGGDQAGEVATALADAGLSEITAHKEDDGQERSIEARLPDRPRME
jgi:hypothetical protein